MSHLGVHPGRSEKVSWRPEAAAALASSSECAAGTCQIRKPVTRWLAQLLMWAGRHHGVVRAVQQ